MWKPILRSFSLNAGYSTRKRISVFAADPHDPDPGFFKDSKYPQFSVFSPMTWMIMSVMP